MDKKRPVICVLPLADTDRESWWMLPGYMELIREAGGLPLMPALGSDKEEIEQIAAMADGFLFTGGQDVDPALYGEENRACGTLSHERDELEAALLPLALAADKPVLGICRGLQFLNAHLGGTLWQDLPTEYDSPIRHRMQKPYHRDAHSVNFLPDTPFVPLFGEGEYGVNSLHHQAIRTLGEGLQPGVVSSDGLIEAVWMPGKRFVMAVQWHPELRRENEGSRALAAAFVEACR